MKPGFKDQVKMAIHRGICMREAVLLICFLFVSGCTARDACEINCETAEKDCTATCKETYPVDGLPERNTCIDACSTHYNRCMQRCGDLPDTTAQ